MNGALALSTFRFFAPAVDCFCPDADALLVTADMMKDNLDDYRTTIIYILI